MTRTASQVVRYAGYGVTIILLGFAAYGVGESLLGVQAYRVIADNPSSMSKAINYGDVAVVYGAAFRTIAVGDIVVFHDPRGNPGIMIHRVVEIDSCGSSICLVTKGDNNETNPTIDPWNVTQASYVGKVELVVPYIGYISPALCGIQGIPLYVLLASVAGIVVVATFLRPGHWQDNESGVRDGSATDAREGGS